jgi:hypothetical protein
LGELELVLAALSRTFGMGTADGKIHWDDELTIAYDHEQQHAINAGDGMFEWATPPPADEPKVFAVFSKHRIIDDPSP